MRAFLMILLLAECLCAQSTEQTRKTIERALPLLERSANEFVAKRACVSCHHNILPVLMFHLAAERGINFDRKTLASVEQRTFRQLITPDALDDAIQAAALNDPTPNDSFLLMAAHAAGMQPNLVTEVYARRLVGWQNAGHWVTSDFRPPHSSSLFTTTASAVRAIRLYLPDEIESVRKAREWLLATEPESTEDAAFGLMGIVWSGATTEDIAQARTRLLARQQADGGWAQIPGYASDAYSTGEALFALHEAGMPPEAREWSKGAKYLINTQAKSGAWRVSTRMVSPAEVSPPYFSTTFPYEKDEFISYAGSCWAVMALLQTLPATSLQQTPISDKVDAPPWLRTVLFGRFDEFKSLLDSGFDVNSKTANGTTVLMMVAPDAAKVRLAIERGADVTARAASGRGPLSVAASYRGSADALNALIGAGAVAKAPETAPASRPPLVLAAMAGDAACVQALLHTDSDSLTDALGQAITFGHFDVVRLLIQAGASTQFLDSSGINLVHWAVITNRVELIPILLDAGISIDAQDDWGFTPLMYAATIDFGDTNALKRLLESGANRTVRNYEGRTALDLARRYKHRFHEALLLAR